MTTANKIIALLLTGTLLLNGCGKKESSPAPATPLEAAEYVMESIRDLDMETLNRYTDNYVGTYHTWIGIPIENEYRSFNELLQPRSRNSSRYKSSYRLDQKMMEKLTWEITEVSENGSTAEIDMTITNIDMEKVMTRYETRLLENVLEAPGSGIAQLVRDTTTVEDTLASLIDELNESDMVTTSVTVCAWQDQGQWKIHMNPEFINAFSGNMYVDIDSEEISELEELLDTKMNEWAEDFEDKVEKWAERFEDKMDW